MARQRTPPAQQTPPPQQAPLPPGQVATAIGAETALAVAPVAAGAVAAAAVTAATAKILAGLTGFFDGRRRDDSLFLAMMLRQDYPQRTTAQIDGLVASELGRQAEFERRAEERMKRDLPKALAETDPEKRREAVNRLLEREKRYVEMRQAAMVERASARAEHMDVKLASPEGAYWKLDPTVKKHTLDCVLMGEKFWPWEVLDKIHPLLHTGCQCHLYTKREAMERGWLFANHVVNVKDAVKTARAYMERAHQVKEAAYPGEIEAWIEERLEEAARGPATEQACHYFRDGCKERATKSLIWADGRAYIPVCNTHEKTARAKIAEQHDEVNRIVLVEAAAVKGAMVALYPTDEAAAALAIKGGEPAEDLHITLKFLGKDATEIKGRDKIEAALAKWAKTAKPLAGKVVGMGEFKANPDWHPDEKPIFAKPDIPGIQEFRKSLVAALPAGVMEDTHPEYKPHITLDYIPADAKPPTDKLDQVPLVFDRVYLVWSGERVAFMLGTGERIEESFEERLHPRGRAGRFIRVHLTSGKSVLLGNAHVDIGGEIRGSRVDAHGRVVLDSGGEDAHKYLFSSVKRIEELHHEYGKGDDAKLIPRETLAGDNAQEHLNFLFRIGYEGSEHKTWPLTMDEKDALNAYRHEHGYQTINNALRSGSDMDETVTIFAKHPGYSKYAATHTVSEWIDLMDAAIKKAPRTGVALDMFVYRGIRDTAALFGGEPRVGQHVTDLGYVSTTTDADTARTFASRAPGWAPSQLPVDPSVIEVEMPPGTQGAWMRGAFGLDQYGSEFVLPRGSKFEVTGVRHDLGNKPGEMLRVVEARLVVSVQEAIEGVEGFWRLEEARYDEHLHPRGRHGKWVRKPIRNVLRRITPSLKPANAPEHRAPLQERGTEQGRYVWLRGRYVFVPRHRAFHRKIDHVTFHSPAGGTNIYRNGNLVQIEGEPAPPHHRDLNPPAQADIRNLPGTAEYSPAGGEKSGGALVAEPVTTEQYDNALLAMAEKERGREAIFTRVETALRDMNENVQPIYVGDSMAAASDALETAGFQSGEMHQHGRVGTITYTHHLSGAETTLSWNVGFNYVVTDVHDWKPGKRGWDTPAPPLDRPAKTWSEFADEVRGIAYRLAHEHGQEPVVGEVKLGGPGDRINGVGGYDDHTGTHNSWDGKITLGTEVEDVLKLWEQFSGVEGNLSRTRHVDTDLARSVYASYKVATHEAIHGGGTSIGSLYSLPEHKGIEEAITEELAHVETAKLMRAHGVTEPLAWARANPNEYKVLGTYHAYRQALDRVLTVAKVAPELREDYIRDLRWGMPPGERIYKLAADVEKATGMNDGYPFVKDLFTRAGDGLAEGFHPILRADLREFPSADGVILGDKRVTVGSVVKIDWGERVEKRDKNGKLRSRWRKTQKDVIVEKVGQPGTPGFKFKLDVRDPDTGQVSHNIVDTQVVSVEGHVNRDENQRPGFPFVTVGGRSAFDQEGATITKGARVRVADGVYDGEEGVVTGITGHPYNPLLDIQIDGESFNSHNFADQVVVLKPGEELPRITVGDTITYDGRADGGRSEAVVTAVHVRNDSYGEDLGYSLEAITTKNSLKPDTLVLLTEDRMNGVELAKGQPEPHQTLATVTQLPERAKAPEPVAIAAGRPTSSERVKVRLGAKLLHELSFLEGPDTGDPQTPGSEELAAEIGRAWKASAEDTGRAQRPGTIELSTTGARYLLDALDNSMDIWADHADPDGGSTAEQRQAARGFQRSARTIMGKVRTRLGEIDTKLDPPEGPPGPRAEAVQLTPDEFAAHERTWWHGTRFGKLADSVETSGQGFHIGTYEAARQALAARSGFDHGPREAMPERRAGAWRDLQEWLGQIDPTSGAYSKESPAFGVHEGKVKLNDDGVIDVTMTGSNVPFYAGALKHIADRWWLGLRVNGELIQEPGPRAHTSSGKLAGAGPDVKPDKGTAMVPVWITGAMSNTTGTPHEDFAANGRMASALRRGVAKRGYFYKNVSEDEGSISAVLPSRAHVRTHEDFVREAVQRGEQVPAHVLAHYPHLTGGDKADTPEKSPEKLQYEKLDAALRAFGAHDLETLQQWRPDLYERHPLSGYMVRNDQPRASVIHNVGEPPRIQDTVPNKYRMNEEPVPGTVRPPTHLYRAVSEADYQQALARGFLQSDQRMNLADEGTVAAFTDPTFYLPGKLASDKDGVYPARLLKIAYRDEDGWKLDTDGYVKTPLPIPMSQIVDTLPMAVHRETRLTPMGNEIPYIHTEVLGSGDKSGGETTAKFEGDGPLPMENGLYYRLHTVGAPFGPEHASTVPPIPEEIAAQSEVMRGIATPKEGYSAFWNPLHLVQYAESMGWADRNDEGAPVYVGGSKGVRVIAFRGTPVGEGSDGEPRVMPESSKVLGRMSWRRFADRAEMTNAAYGYGRWDEHTWGDGPDGRIVDDGYRSVANLSGDKSGGTPDAGMVERKQRTEDMYRWVANRIGAEFTPDRNPILPATRVTRNGAMLAIPLTVTGNTIRGDAITHAEPTGTGLGTDFVNALKEYADEHGLTVQLHNISNPRFWGKFPWLEQWGTFRATDDMPARPANNLRYVPGDKSGGSQVPNDQAVYIAEGAMKRAGQDGGPMISRMGHIDTPEQQAENERLSKLAQEISGDPTLRAQVSNWIAGPTGEHGHALYDRSFHKILIRPVSDKLTFLHEIAHAMTRTEHGDGHSSDFINNAHALYAKHISTEAAQTFWNLVGDRVPKAVWPHPIPADPPKLKRVGSGVYDSTDGRVTMYRIEGVHPPAWNVEWTIPYQNAVLDALAGGSQPGDAVSTNLVDGAASMKDAVALFERGWPQTRAYIEQFEQRTVQESAATALLESLGIPESEREQVAELLLAMPTGARTAFVADWLQETGETRSLATILG